MFEKYTIQLVHTSITNISFEKTEFLRPEHEIWTPRVGSQIAMRHFH